VIFEFEGDLGWVTGTRGESVDMLLSLLDVCLDDSWVIDVSLLLVLHQPVEVAQHGLQYQQNLY